MDWNSIGIGLAGFLVTLVFYFLISRGLGAVASPSSSSSSSSPLTKRPHVLIIGPTGSGKTALFVQLRFGNGRKPVGTLPSLEINQGPWTPAEMESGKSLDLVDIPGHPKLRSLLIPEHLNPKRNVSGVLLMLNSTSTVFLAQYRDVAEFLYTVLAHPMVRKRQLPVLIACHFQDQKPKAFGKDRIRSMLELEMDKVRQSRTTTAAIAEQGSQNEGQPEDDVYLGFDGKPFAFEDLENEVSFVETDRADIGPIEQWLEQRVQ